MLQPSCKSFIHQNNKGISRQCCQEPPYLICDKSQRQPYSNNRLYYIFLILNDQHLEQWSPAQCHLTGRGPGHDCKNISKIYWRHQEMNMPCQASCFPVYYRDVCSRSSNKKYTQHYWLIIFQGWRWNVTYFALPTENCWW